MDAIGNELLFPARHGQNERMIALGRKNHLFAGSDSGAARWATVASLIATAKLNDDEPFAYLRECWNACQTATQCASSMTCRPGIGPSEKLQPIVGSNYSEA
jgi:hypothetical protein